MDRFRRAHTLMEAAFARATGECSVLLGQELSAGDAAGSIATRENYLERLENASFVVGIESEEDYAGMLYLVFALRDAIVLGSILLGVPAARILEKKRLAIIETDDIDAFSEIANQLTGSFNAVFEAELPGRVHLKLLTPRKFIPGEDGATAEEPFPAGDYYLCRTELRMAGQDLERLDLLVPFALAERFAVAGAEPEAELPAAPEAELPVETAVDEPTPSVLVLDESAADRTSLQEMLAACGMRPVAGTPDANLSRLCPAEEVKAIVLGVGSADDRELSLCTKLKAHYGEESVPIIVSSRQWTRSGVLRALKYGARDILLKPFSPEELSGKLRNLVGSL